MEEITTELTTILEEGAEVAEEAVASGPMNIVFTILSLIILAVVVLFTYSIKKKTGNNYDDYIETVNQNECRVKKFLPIGLYIDQNINWISKLPKPLYPLVEILGRRRNEVRMMIIELRDAKYGDYYYSIFSAEKKVYGLFIAIAASALGFIMGLQGDGETGFGIAVAGFALAIAFGFLLEANLKKKIENKQMLLRMEFPDFVNQLVLLINAGMTVSRAWAKIVNDSKKDTPLYRELHIAYLSMKNGTPEAYAIEAFGRRCKIKEIMKFTSVLISNLRKGGSELVPVLIQQSNECWEMRKSAAKELGATAGVKMMLPMVMLLLAILIVVGFPAMLSLQGGI